MYDRVISLRVFNTPSDIHNWRAVALEPCIVASGRSREAAVRNVEDKVARAYPGERVLCSEQDSTESFYQLEERF